MIDIFLLVNPSKVHTISLQKGETSNKSLNWPQKWIPNQTKNIKNTVTILPLTLSQLLNIKTSTIAPSLTLRRGSQAWNNTIEFVWLGSSLQEKGAS